VVVEEQDVAFGTKRRGAEIEGDRVGSDVDEGKLGVVDERLDQVQDLRRLTAVSVVEEDNRPGSRRGVHDVGQTKHEGSVEVVDHEPSVLPAAEDVAVRRAGAGTVDGSILRVGPAVRLRGRSDLRIGVGDRIAVHPLSTSASAPWSGVASRSSSSPPQPAAGAASAARKVQR